MHPPSLSLRALVPFTFALTACAHAAGTQPHEMSAAEHQAAATQAEAEGGGHADDFQPGARATETRCAPGRTTAPQGVCWFESVNPTAEHREAARKQREIAAQHRTASRALVQAEASACAGLAEDDRDISPFAHARDIASVSELRQEKTTQSLTKQVVGGTTGARIVLRAVPGLTEQWLQRIVDCHLARNAALGHEAASTEMAFCPLTLRGAQARVSALYSGFAVDVRSDDPEAAKEIWQRAQLLAQASQ